MYSPQLALATYDDLMYDNTTNCAAELGLLLNYYSPSPVV